MKDPFFIPPIPALTRAIQPFADYFHFTTLPLHIHEVLAACLLYTFINFVLSPFLSSRIFPNHYGKLPPSKRLSWDVHVVSFVQSSLINTLALWVMFIDRERAEMSPLDRVYGYTGAAGMIQALAAGYFLWDLIITAIYLPVFGLGMLAHATCALVVFSFGFRPFVNYYGCVFILWELSSPFLNIHWFCDKLGLTGSNLQLYNGIALIITFFSCRLVYGTYQATRVFSDVWLALHSPAPPNDPDGVLLFSDEATPIPLWLAIIYLGSNTTLNGLNFYWFMKMIDAVRKRFVPQKEASAVPVEAKPKLGTSSNGVATGIKAEAAPEDLRHRAKAKTEDEDSEECPAVT